MVAGDVIGKLHQRVRRGGGRFRTAHQHDSLQLLLLQLTSCRGGGGARGDSGGMRACGLFKGKFCCCCA